MIAEREGARLVLADRLHDLAERRVDRAHNQPEADQEHGEHEIVHRQRVAEIDHAEEIAARHPLNAVLAAGEFGLQAEEEHHLREGQRDHREIDALAADREIAEYEAEGGGDRNRGEEAEYGRKTPHLDGMRRDVGGAAEEGGMPERKKAVIADEQIE